MATVGNGNKLTDPLAQRGWVLTQLSATGILACALAGLIYVMWRNVEATQASDLLILEAYKARTIVLEKDLELIREQVAIERERLLVERSILEALRK